MIETRPGPDDDLRERIIADLSAHAEAAGVPFVNEQITLRCVEDGVYLGGMTARVMYNWLFVELLATAPEARGTGTGSALMAAAEAEAAKRGLAGVYLDTFAFQAPGFYRKLGYSELGRIDDFPDGHYRVWLAKRLRS